MWSLVELSLNQISRLVYGFGLGQRAIFEVQQASDAELRKSEEIFEYHGFDFLQSASDVVEFAITQGMGRDCFDLMQRCC